MEKYRKTATIELVDVHKGTGDKVVQNEGDESDRWVIPKEIFEKTYERVGPELEPYLITFFNEWVWQSDWNGDEVGFDDRNVVGLYSRESINRDQKIYAYIDAETGQILDLWSDTEY